MKQIKKIICLILIMTLVIALPVNVSAASTKKQTSAITLSNTKSSSYKLVYTRPIQVTSLRTKSTYRPSITAYYEIKNKIIPSTKRYTANVSYSLESLTPKIATIDSSGKVIVGKSVGKASIRVKLKISRSGFSTYSRTYTLPVSVIK